MKSLRHIASYLGRTPLHPQWLLGPRDVPSGISSVSGPVLDIGAADRWIEAHLTSEASYVALDYPSTGRDLYGAHPDVFADAASLPFPDGQFAGVVCLEVLEHVADPAVVVREIARVLMPGGHAWLSMPFLYPLHDAPFDYQRYTEFGLRRDIERAGMEVLTFRKSGHAIRSAALLMCLAIAGGNSAKRGLTSLILLPVTTIAVFTINITAWAFSLVWPDWSHMAMGYKLLARKSWMNSEGSPQIIVSDHEVAPHFPQKPRN